MSGFTCPFCGNTMSVYGQTVSTFRFNFDGHISNDPVAISKAKYITLTIYSCPSCGKESAIASGVNGYMDNIKKLIYPDAIYRHFPDYVPLPIRLDYEEAARISNISPKASATLCRRCLQGMIRDFWGIKKGRLIDEIKELQGKVPTVQWKAIDALRNIGNIGAHMEKDVNLVLDVDEDEARVLLSLIENLIEKWYINRHEEESLYQTITAVGAAKRRT